MPTTIADLVATISANASPFNAAMGKVESSLQHAAARLNVFQADVARAFADLPKNAIKAARLIGDAFATTGGLIAAKMAPALAKLAAPLQRITDLGRAAARVLGRDLANAVAPLTSRLGAGVGAVGALIQRAVTAANAALAGRIAAANWHPRDAQGHFISHAAARAAGMAPPVPAATASFRQLAQNLTAVLVPAFRSVAASGGRILGAAFAGVARTAASAFNHAASAARAAFGRAAGAARSALGSMRGMLGGIGFGGLGLFGGIGGSVGLGLGMHAAAGAAIDLESRLAQVSKTTGATGDQLGKIKSQLTGLASTMAGVKIGDLFDIATMGGRMGVSADNIGRFARDIGMIRVALDDIPAEEAATGIARVLNVFGKGTGEAINFASALNKLDDSSTASGRDILDITTRIASSASVLGLSAQKALALSAALKDAGVNNEIAGTAMSRVMKEMATNTRGFAEVAGVAESAFREALRADPLKALQLFLAGLAKLDKLDQFQALKGLKIQGAGVSQVLLSLNAVMPKLNGYVATANREWVSLASIQAEYAKQAATTKAQLDRMGNVLYLTGAAIGNALLPILKAAADAVVMLATDVQSYLTANQGTVDAWSGRVARAVRFAGLAFREFPTFVELARIEIGEKLEQLQVIAGRAGRNIWQGIKFGAVAGFTFLRNTAAATVEFLDDIFRQLAGNMAGLIKNLFVGMAPALKLFGSAGGAIASGLQSAAGGLAGGLKMPAINMRTDLFSGANLTKGMPTAPKFEGLFGNLPNRAADMKPALDRLSKALDANTKQLEDERAGVAAGAGGVQASGVGGFRMGDLRPGAPGGAGGRMLPGKAKKETTHFDLVGFVKHIQEGIFKAKGPEDQTARNTHQANEHLAQIRQGIDRMANRGQPAVAVGPA